MLITDSVCLRVLDADHLLVAVGNSLHHYHQPADSTSPAKCVVLADLLPEHIHSILSVPRQPSSSGHHHIVVLGGRHLLQLRLHEGRLTRLANRDVRLNDWISSGALLYDGTELVVLTCHGVAVRMALSWPPDEEHCKGARIVSTLKCPDKSTLYCSRIVCDALRTAASGWNGLTFLGGTAFGELIAWADTADGPRVLHRASSHNGVIFSIDCDPRQRLLITTSDDRSVKVWQLNDADGGWSVSLQRTLFAHTGRVFRCRLLEDGHLLSAGEDGQLCLWQSLSGRLLARQPFGTALWHIDYDAGAQMAYVASSAGHCEQFCLAGYLQNGATGERAEDEVSVDSLTLPSDEHIVKVRFVQAHGERPHIVAVTNRNRLVAGHPDGKWNFDGDVPFKISLLEVHGNRVAVAGFKLCRIYEYNSADCTLKLIMNRQILDGMVQTLKFIAGDEFLVGDATGNAVLLDVRNAIGRQFRMVPCKEPWATAVCRPSAELLIVGDRCGHLHLYETAGDAIELRCTLRNVHGRLGCTTLNIERPSQILCSGHDGTLKRIQLDAEGRRLRLCHTLTVPMGWVQSVHMASGIVLGFDSDRCVVWQRHTQQTLASFECGGGHRYADVHIGTGSGEFVYLRRNALRWLRFARNLRTRFRLPAARRWHSLSCTVVQVCRLGGGDRRSLIVSGGDDNVLKFHLLHADRSLQHLEDVCTHVSSIKALLVHRLRGGNAWRIISAGGRAQICITDVRLSEDDADEKTLLHVQEVGQFMLHLSDVERRRTGTANTVDASAEARFMAVAALGDAGAHFVAGCSDGLLRCFEVTDGALLRVVQSSAYGKCILKVLTIRSRDDDAWCIVTAATDGKLCFWRWRCGVLDAEPFGEVRHHRSGVQSMDYVRCTADGELDDGFALVTGGDDQSVVVSSIRLDDKRGVLEVVYTQQLQAMHTAQVNGVCFVGERRLYTTGVDQTVVRWERAEASDEWQASRLDVRTAVADVKGVQVWRDDVDEGVDNVLVYGYGVQVHRNRSKIQ